MLTAIIVAAGSSRRMGFDKLTASIADKPVIEHTVDAFAQTAAVSEIVVVTRSERISEMERLLAGKAKLRAVIAGGEHRQDSVNAGLGMLDAGAKFVAVHDGARPLVTRSQIEEVLAQARAHGAAALAEPVTDTLKRVDAALYVQESIDRQRMYAMQTPQIFARALLEEAYGAVFAQHLQITDEVSAVQHLGRPVALVPCADFNFKITFARDLRLADFILRERAGCA
jgi:2-C-methyl-D-erythritol 4-phosphate cytidylyltransferase